MGIVAGQAWECEPVAQIQVYQRLKTGALFSAATMGGAACAGADPRAWRVLGEALGEAYQVADDIRDVLMDSVALGKPACQDQILDRPSAARQLGLEGALAYFDGLIANAIEGIPACRGAVRLRNLVLRESERLLPLQQRSMALDPQVSASVASH
jgi:geranylgeranyl diphosphate synthase type II